MVFRGEPVCPEFTFSVDVGGGNQPALGLMNDVYSKDRIRTGIRDVQFLGNLAGVGLCME